MASSRPAKGAPAVARRERPGARRGMALVNVMFLTIMSSLFLLAATRFVTDSSKMARASRDDTRTFSVAKAGLEQAISWIRKNPAKPVKIFDPVQPAETSNERIGLVRDYEIDPATNLWGRYEVGRSSNAPAGRGTPATVAGAGTGGVYGTAPTWVAEDVSTRRGRPSGEVWLLRVRAYTYVTPTPGSAGFSPTMRGLKTVTLESEISLNRFTPRPAAFYLFGDGATMPNLVAESGYCAVSGGHVQIHVANGGDARLEVEDGYGLVIWSNTPESKLIQNNFGGGGSNIAFGGTRRMGLPSTNVNYVNPSLSEQLNYSFGANNLTDAAGGADYVYSASNPLPAVMPRTGFIYIDASGMPNQRAEFAGSNKLAGEGVILVNGHLRLDGETQNQTYDGMIFTTGDFEMSGAVNITGGVISGGRVRYHCVTNHLMSITYSRSTLDRVLKRTATYREAHVARRLGKTIQQPTQY